mgnify:CR=1 FL=1
MIRNDDAERIQEQETRNEPTNQTMKPMRPDFGVLYLGGCLWRYYCLNPRQSASYVDA